MNQITSLSIALALAAILVAPAEAAKKESPGKNKEAPAAAVQQKHARSAAPPQTASRQPSKSKAPQRTVQAAKPKAEVSSQRSAVTRQSTGQSHKLATQQNPVSQLSYATQSREVQQRSQQPVIAERRSTERRGDRSSNVTNRYDERRYESNTSSHSYNRVPYSTYRDWDTDRVHYWDSRPYRWFGGSWVFYSDYEPYASTRVVYSRSGSASLVDDVQAALSDAGYRPGPIDGVMGSQTRNAIASYQADRGLSVTGRIDTSLLRSLGL